MKKNGITVAAAIVVLGSGVFLVANSSRGQTTADERDELRYLKAKIDASNAKTTPTQDKFNQKYQDTVEYKAWKALQDKITANTEWTSLEAQRDKAAEARDLVLQKIRTEYQATPEGRASKALTDQYLAKIGDLTKRCKTGRVLDQNPASIDYLRCIDQAK